MKKYYILLLFIFPFLTGRAQIADSSKRHVPTQGAANFRDLGGYATRCRGCISIRRSPAA